MTLMKQFLERHTSRNLVEQIQKALKQGSDIETLFSQFVEENCSYTPTSDDEAEIERQEVASFEAMLVSKIKHFKAYQEGKLGLGYNVTLSVPGAKLAKVFGSKESVNMMKQFGILEKHFIK